VVAAVIMEIMKINVWLVGGIGMGMFVITVKLLAI
jgi:hypothetical protein